MIKEKVISLIRSSLASIDRILGGSSGGYDSADASRLNKLFQLLNENSISPQKLRNLEANAVDLWRNNPHARKIVRQLQTKTIGTGMRPLPQAMKDGKPFVEFRKRCKEVWAKFILQSDSRGLPGKGGQHFTDQSKTAIASTIRTGNVFYRLRFVTTEEQKRRGLFLPITVQLVDAARLDDSFDTHNGNRVYRGIEVDDNGSVIAYHMRDAHPSDRWATQESTRIPSDAMGHVFIGEDIDQYSGVSWFAPILDTSRDVDDYTYNELKAAVLSSCVVFGISGMQGGKTGVSAPGATTDNYGNAIANMAPGQFVNLGQNGKIEGFDPKRPNTNAVDFVKHLLRQVSAGIPGIKGTTLTGDYRGSSFSSEKAADNDTWPEIEAIQQWWSCAYQQPVYEQVMITAIMEGKFADVISNGEFAARRQELLQCNWQGPVSKSINPKDDRISSRLGIKNGQSSVLTEANKVGADAIEELQNQVDLIKHIEQLEIDDKYRDVMIMNALGVDAQAVAQDAENAGDTESDEQDDSVDDSESVEEMDRRLSRLEAMYVS